MSEKKAEISSEQHKSKISGHVFSNNGAVLNGAKITCNGLETWALADGFYTFDDLPLGTFEVRVSLQGFQSESKRVSIDDNKVAVLDFYLSEALGTAKIKGRVYDSESKRPVTDRGTVIIILPLFNKYAHFDEEGFYEFSNLHAGTYRISTSIPDYEDSDAVITVGDGESKTYDLVCKARKAVEPPWG